MRLVLRRGRWRRGYRARLNYPELRAIVTPLDILRRIVVLFYAYEERGQLIELRISQRSFGSLIPFRFDETRDAPLRDGAVELAARVARQQSPIRLAHAKFIRLDVAAHQGLA